jgi:renalase
MERNLHTDVIIIGAGISGLMAANKLEQNGASVRVLEKNPQVGGRLATLDIGTGRGDHGAQFFTVHSPEFQRWVERWVDDGVVFLWSKGFSDGSLLLLPSLNNYPHYAVNEGMRALPEHLARSLKNVQVNSGAATATYDEISWIIQDEDGLVYTSRALVLTTPVPLALALLVEGATDLTELDFDVLSAITYAPCLTGVFWVDGIVELPSPGAIQRHNTNVIWMGNNRQKGISPQATIITLQASGQYSTQMWDAPDDRIMSAMYAQLKPFLPEEAAVKSTHLQRWQYARPVTSHKARCLVAAGGIPLVFAGDAFQGPRVEGAALSGLAAATAILKLLQEE